ncbi:50S ribosomal protein L10 [Heliophilum fasciatum]|uniref:Large ribosomal subunit protein uL10 n=1 Tax=Heliophilum fasciatum TaxID=35700 RepID=A0A4R2RXG7_9FIRM|nr:50S ribosomal protein L10 [Heliophilum fasciatum]MCW2277826.1 large subunit ribosomal protein L10 [Heliophilum fasciatum]TCP64681.1 LSU ribosomal protein L10P [Heliophilum fasciatum]
MTYKPEKVAAIAELQEKLQKAQSCVLVNLKGMTVAEATQLRSKLRAAGVELSVCKNTLLGIAAKQVGIEGLDTYLAGPTAIAFSMNDPVSAAKIISEFLKNIKGKEYEIKAGIIDGKVITADEVKVLADLPPREVLLAQVLAGIQGPLVGLVNVLQGPIRKFAYALEDLRKQRESA